MRAVLGKRSTRITHAHCMSGGVRCAHILHETQQNGVHATEGAAEKRGRRTHRGEVNGCSIIAHVATELEDPLSNCPEEYYGQQRAMLLASTTHARLPSKLPR